MTRVRGVFSIGVVLGLGFVLGPALAQEKTESKPAEVAPSQVGKKETAKWTETTTAAAGTPEQRAVLESGKVATLTGELVEVSCFLQLGKRGEKHIPCGSECLKNGQPFGLLTADKTLYLVLAEEHDPRRHGETDLREALIPLLAKQVTLTGMHVTHDGYHAIYVQAFELPGGKKEAKN